MASLSAVDYTHTASKLLVIDDETSLRKNIVSYLTGIGYDVLEADNARTGVELFKTQQPDLVLCDLRMPGVDGLEILKRISQLNSQTPLIVISCVGDTDEVVEALRLGASDFLIKPIEDMEVLQHSITRGLKQAKLVQENIEYSKELQKTNAELRKSLDLLRLDQQAGLHVQQCLLPKSPINIHGFRFQHRIIPSLYLSGDFVDYMDIGKGKVLFYIADVSGHGSSSAFVTVLLKYLVARTGKDYLEDTQSVEASPAAALSSLNKEILAANLDKHVTVFMGILDVEGNEMIYSSAGHYPMPIIGVKGSYNYLKGGSFPVGIQEAAEYTDDRLVLSDDFTITLFSDGVLELLNFRSLMEKEQYLLEATRNCHGDYEKLSNILSLNQAIRAPDDIAMMCIRKS